MNETARESLWDHGRVEAALRHEWWLNHGCDFSALYGDDGEMQCGTCHHDFKREPLEPLFDHVWTRRVIAAQEARSE